MSKRFRLKQRPTKPKKRDRPHTVYLSDGDSLKEIFDKMGNTDPATIIFNEDYDGNYRVSWTVLDTDEELALRMGTYKVRMTEYNAWHEENKEAIDKEYALRAKLREQQIAKSKETRKHDIRMAILSLKKEQKRLELEEKS